MLVASRLSVYDDIPYKMGSDPGGLTRSEGFWSAKTSSLARRAATNGAAYALNSGRRCANCACKRATMLECI